MGGAPEGNNERDKNVFMPPHERLFVDKEGYTQCTVAALPSNSVRPSRDYFVRFLDGCSNDCLSFSRGSLRL